MTEEWPEVFDGECLADDNLLIIVTLQKQQKGDTKRLISTDLV